LQAHKINAHEIEKFQIMFMSMGEPLLNWSNVSAAIASLALLYPQAQLLISTTAPDVPTVWKDLFEVSARYPQVGLQFSIHHPYDHHRDNLIPFKNKLDLRALAAMGCDWFGYTGRKPFFNYCAQELNSDDVCADKLADLFDPSIWNCTVSVVCERTENVAHANDRQRKLADDFMSKMLLRGFDVRKFDPAGQDDIGGGCGQSYHIQKWVRDNPERIRKSAGTGLMPVHMPTYKLQS
jgi:23S rRNA (adenine2503-C2)-methyltransferase